MIRCLNQELFRKTGKECFLYDDRLKIPVPEEVQEFQGNRKRKSIFSVHRGGIFLSNIPFQGGEHRLFLKILLRFLEAKRQQIAQW